MPNLVTPRMLLAETPFAGEGVSLYAQQGTSIQYRTPCVFNGLILPSGSGKLRQNPIPRTTRVAFVSSPAVAIDYEFPPEWSGSQVAVNVRTFADGIENDDFEGLQVIRLNGDGDLVNEILGTATLLQAEKRDGGKCLLRFRYDPSVEGIQPATFVATKTAGPGTVADVSTSYLSASWGGTSGRVYELVTPALTDGEDYTFKIQAVNGPVSQDLITGITFTADSSGPPAPSNLSIAES